MKKLLLLIILTASYLIPFAQNCPNQDFTGNPELITTSNKPNPTTLKEMVGLTAGREWDGIYLNGLQNTYDFTKVSSFARIFHEMQRDYATASGQAADPNGANTPGNNPQGPNINAGLNNWSEFYGMNDNYQSFRLWYNHFKSSIGDDFNGFMFSLTTAPFGQRRFPIGWYTNEEWGGGDDFNPNVNQIKNNAKNYVKAFAKTYCPKAGDADCPGIEEDYCPCMVDVLEVGNEPWGYINANTFTAILEGMLDGLDEYYGVGNIPFDVIPGAFQAHEFDIPENDPMQPVSWVKESWRDYMGTRIPCELKDRLDGVNVHPYSFDHNGFTLSAYPEKTGAPGVDDGSHLQHIKNAVKWNDTNMSGKKVYVTEYGWDSQITGEIAQSRYMMRSTLMFARLGVHRAAFYEGLDSDDSVTGDPNKMGLFESCGVWRTGPTDRTPQPNGQKEAYNALLKMRTILGEKIFLHSISEEDNGAYAYLFGEEDGSPTHLVYWLAKESSAASEVESINLPQQFSLQMGNQARLLDGDLSGGGTGTAHNPDLQDGSGTSGTIRMVMHTTPMVVPINNPEGCRYLADGSLDCSGIDPCGADEEAPVFSSCPADIRVTTLDREVVVNWEAPTVTDNCTQEPIISANYNPGTAFPIGSTTTVTYTTKDDSGNTTVCSFTITVTTGADPCDTDTEAPVLLNCPQNISLTTAGTTAVVSWVEPTATDNCTANLTLSSNYSPGDEFPLGTTTVSYLVKDRAQNVATCSFEVTITEEEGDGSEGGEEEGNAGIDCPADIIVTADASGATLVSWTEPDAYTDCTAGGTGDCADENISGFTYLGSHNGSSYYLSEDIKRWSQAKSIAENLGGHLAIVENAEENEFIRQGIADKGISTAFIGLSDDKIEGSFEWVDGATMGYSEMADNNSTSFDYVYMGSWTTGPWYLAVNVTRKNFIVELPCSGDGNGGDSEEPMVARTDAGPANGESWAVGTYEINYQMIDACNNVASCSFMVTVLPAEDNCTPVSSAGTINGAETACEGYDPALITSGSVPTGGSEDLVYQWQVSTTGPNAGWSNIAGAIGLSYDPMAISTTTWYRRGVRSSNCSDYLYTAAVMKEVGGDDCGGGIACDGAPIEGFTHLGSFENSEYYVSNEIKRWEVAKTDAEAMGGHLAVIETVEENAFIHEGISFADVNSAFIGLSDRAQSGVFQWVDGSAVTYEHWGGLDGSGDNTKYIYMGSWLDGLWYKAGNGVYKPYVVEIPCNDNMEEEENLQALNEDTGEGSLNDAEDGGNEISFRTEVEATNWVDSRLFPNPVKDMFTFEVADASFQKIIIYDVSGRKRYERTFESDVVSMQLDISFLPNGIYILSAEGSAFGAIQKRFIKAYR